MFKIFISGCCAVHLGYIACFLVFVLTWANIGMWVDTLFVPAGATPETETAQMVHYSLTGVTLGVAILTAIAAQCM